MALTTRPLLLVADCALARMKKRKPKKKTVKPGPKEDRVRIEGDLERRDQEVADEEEAARRLAEVTL